MGNKRPHSIRRVGNRISSRRRTLRRNFGDLIRMLSTELIKQTTNPGMLRQPDVVNTTGESKEAEEETEAGPVEEELALDEWKTLHAGRLKPIFNTRRLHQNMSRP
ncbi:hypothetical protein QE152_g4494 [Popillia japonica]|uniref:Uncharacterized protein n=1 Tax=Popillia japonica TaxID=7064 RepID=A0AAW1MUC0_POPJA